MQSAEHLIEVLYVIMGVLYVISFFMVTLFWVILGKPAYGKLGKFGTLFSMWLIGPFFIIYKLFKGK
jgi:hypothetical protein